MRMIDQVKYKWVRRGGGEGMRCIGILGEGRDAKEGMMEGAKG